MCLLHGNRPVYKRAGVRREGLARQKDAAGAHAVFQAGELFHGAGGADPGGATGSDRERLRLSDSSAAAEGGERGAEAAGEGTGPLPCGAEPSEGRQSANEGCLVRGIDRGERRARPGKETQAKGIVTPVPGSRPSTQGDASDSSETCPAQQSHDDLRVERFLFICSLTASRANTWSTPLRAWISQIGSLVMTNW